MKFGEAALDWFKDLSMQGILITDAELNIWGWNRWLEIHSGRTSAEMIGRNLLEAWPDLVARRLDEYYRDALAGQVRVVSQRLHGYLLPMPPTVEAAPFGQMQQSARIAFLASEGKIVGTITVIEDVTERVERENRLVKLLESEKVARAQAESANRAKDEFLAVVSHELRAPLNAILGWVQIMLTRQFDQESATSALQAIERSAKSQAKLVEDILDASRISTGRLRLDVRPVDPAAIVNAVLDTVRPAADAKSIQIESAIDSGAGMVSADPMRLQQVVWNLLNNAIKFTPGHGRVNVRLERRDSEILLSVCDSGQGISPEFLPFVFDRFRQADSTTTRRHGGLGLGLAIVRHLVELHGGTVRAESDGEGRGATFSLRLPLLASPGAGGLSGQSRFAGAASDGPAGSAPEAAGNSPSEARPLDGLRVLVVDDESDAREILSTMFRQCGAQVNTAATSGEALEVLSEWRPDVLVSDIGMPDEDGYSLISKVRALAPERGGRVPAVALTGYSSAEDRLRLLSAGYQIHMTKPFELDALAAVVATCAGRPAAKSK
jgi:signal transduction histidine kinase/ActR/RegA family two-component response regulator